MFFFSHTKLKTHKKIINNYVFVSIQSTIMILLLILKITKNLFIISKNSKINISIEQKSNVDASFNEPDEKTKINCKRRFSEQLPTKFYF